MRKLALLLGALSLVSAVAYGAEEGLKVTNIGQFIEIDNESGGHNIGEDVHFGNVLGLSYEDWTFEIGARKIWSMDTDKDVSEKDDGEGHIKSTGNRVELTAMRHFDGFDLGVKWRQDPKLDKYYLKGAYSYDMFSGWADLVYVSGNGSSSGDDEKELEMVPVAVTFHDVTLAYYVDINQAVSPSSKFIDDDGHKIPKRTIAQEVRLSAPLYSNDKLGISAEYRYRFREDAKFKGGDAPWQEDNKHVAILNASYQINDALSVSGYYEYDFHKYKGHDEKDVDDNYYGEFCIGWNYSF